MTEASSGKLVRDKIVDLIRERGESPKFHTVVFLEKARALKIKLVEEAGELERAMDRSAILEELADVKEVFEGICAAYNFCPQEIAWRQTRKKAEKGGFDRGIILDPA